jgi:hypothetical protein
MLKMRNDLKLDKIFGEAVLSFLFLFKIISNVRSSSSSYAAIGEPTVNKRLEAPWVLKAQSYNYG